MKCKRHSGEQGRKTGWLDGLQAGSPEESTVRTFGASLRASSLEAGLTLVEVLVALGVLAIAMGGTIIALMQTERRSFESRLQTCALTLAQNQVDLFLNDSDSLVSSNNVIIYDPDPEASGEVGETAANLTVEIGSVAGTEAPDAQRLTATVTYQYLNRTHSVSLTSVRVPN